MPAFPVAEGDQAQQQAAAAGTKEGILRGIYRSRDRTRPTQPRPVRHDPLLCPAWQAAMQARELLASDWGVRTEAWSVTTTRH